MARFSRPYDSLDEAALGGFQNIIQHEPLWREFEFGFLIVGLPRELVRRFGHEAFDVIETGYRYTQPRTDRERERVDQSITPDLVSVARAFCHTHIRRSGFSTGDFNNFKKLQELTAAGKLKHQIVYYMMDSSLQVRRAQTEREFRQGELVQGLDQATP